MKSASRLAIAVAVSTLLAGCDRPKPRDPPPPLPVGDQAATPAPAPVAERLPAWAREFLGKPLTSRFPEAATICVGNADNVQSRLPGPTGGVEIVGWGWDPQARAPIPQILVVDPAGAVVGAGEPGIARPDVNAARPEITAPDTGWSALTGRTRGPVEIYGVVEGGKAICRLGRLELG